MGVFDNFREALAPVQQTAEKLADVESVAVVVQEEVVSQMRRRSIATKTGTLKSSLTDPNDPHHHLTVEGQIINISTSAPGGVFRRNVPPIQIDAVVEAVNEHVGVTDGE